MTTDDTPCDDEPTRHDDVGPWIVRDRHGTALAELATEREALAELDGHSRATDPQPYPTCTASRGPVTWQLVRGQAEKVVGGEVVETLDPWKGELHRRIQRLDS